MKPILTILVLTLAVVAYMVWFAVDAKRFDPDHVAQPSSNLVVGKYHVFAVVGESMQPTLHTGDTLYVLPIRVGDIQHGMILIADYDDGIGNVAKRVERQGGQLFLVGDNRVYSTRYLLHPAKIRGFVETYVASGVTHQWDGRQYLQQ